MQRPQQWGRGMSRRSKQNTVFRHRVTGSRVVKQMIKRPFCGTDGERDPTVCVKTPVFPIDAALC